MAGILEGVLEGDVFVGLYGEGVVDYGCWRNGRGGCGDGRLTGWRSVVGVFEDSCIWSE